MYNPFLWHEFAIKIEKSKHSDAKLELQDEEVQPTLNHVNKRLSQVHNQTFTASL